MRALPPSVPRVGSPEASRCQQIPGGAKQPCKTMRLTHQPSSKCPSRLLNRIGWFGDLGAFLPGSPPLSLTSSCSKDLTPSLAPPAAPQPLDHRASFPSFLMPSSCPQLPHASSSRYFAQPSPSRHSPGGRDAAFAPSPHPDLLPFLTSSVKGPGHRDS